MHADTLLSITHINTLVGQGGTAKIAEALCKTQNAMGHTVRLVVGNMLCPTPLSSTFDTMPCAKSSRIAQAEGMLDYHFHGSHALYQNPVCEDAQLLHFHNLHGGYFNPFSLALLSRLHPSVWTLHDMQSLTGHCAHAYDCSRWQTGCGLCPNLTVYPAVEADNTHRLWRDKRRIYECSPLHIVTPSRWLAKHVEKSILAEQPLSVIPNGIDTHIFSPADKGAARAALGLPQDCLIVGSAAYKGPLHNGWKGGEFALLALEALRTFYPNVLFLGRGNTEEIQVPNIHLLPYAQNEADMATFYAALDIMLYPSLADNCPLVVLEAMACGIPVLAFDIGGIPELVDNGHSGIIVPAHDGDALIKAALALSKSSTARQRMGQNAREKAEKEYDVRIMTSRYEKIYAQTIDTWEDRQSSLSQLKLWEIPPMVRNPLFLECAQAMRLLM